VLSDEGSEPRELNWDLSLAEWGHIVVGAGRSGRQTMRSRLNVITLARGRGAVAGHALEGKRTGTAADMDSQ
jgi:hypothetical protein